MKLHIPGKILLDSRAGSHAHGLNTADSDEDFRGVYVVNKKLFFSSNYPEEISDELNDHSYFELNKFVSLLLKNNPTVLEYLAFPEKHIRTVHPSFKRFTPELVLSKKCGQAFIGYALGQIRKAYELKKRILIPLDLQKKSELDFCTILENGQAIPFSESKVSDKSVSVSEIKELEGLFALQSASQNHLKFSETGEIILDETEGEFLAYITYHKSAWLKYRREFKSYFFWQRDRKLNNLPDTDGRYDGKHFMHTLRLLYMAKDIATKGEIIVERPEREKLLKVRNHELDFKDLVKEAESLIDEVKELFVNSSLPVEPDEQKLREIAFEIRDQMYAEK